jgi:hypothetical protein
METILVVALSILAFGLISGRIEKSIITPPMVFVVFVLLLLEGSSLAYSHAA